MSHCIVYTPASCFLSASIFTSFPCISYTTILTCEGASTLYLIVLLFMPGLGYADKFISGDERPRPVTAALLVCVSATVVVDLSVVVLQSQLCVPGHGVGTYGNDDLIAASLEFTPAL